MSVTLDTLMQQCRDRADMTDSEFIEDAELIRLINRSQEDLYDVLVLNYGVDNFVDGYEFTTAVSQTSYGIPTNIYKLCGLDLKVNSTWYSLLRFSHADRNKYLNATEEIIDGKPRIRYILRTGHLELQPAPTDTYGCRLWYVPQITPLVNTSDTIKNGIVDSFASYIIADVAFRMCSKEETERPDLAAERTEILQKIIAATERDIDTPSPEPDSGVTLFNLKLQARYKADAVTDRSISETELEHYINQSYGELQDILEKATGNYYFLDGYEFVTEVNKRDYDLPADFYKLGGVDLVIGTDKYSIPRYNFIERNLYENTSLHLWNGTPFLHYELLQNSIRLLPAPTAVYNITLWYSKRLSTLTKESDKMSNIIIRDWSEYITIDAAIKILNKKLLNLPPQQMQGTQAVITNLQGQKASMSERLKEMVENRDWGAPLNVVDTELLDGAFWKY